MSDNAYYRRPTSGPQGLNFFLMMTRMSIATVLASLVAIGGTLSADDPAGTHHAHDFVPTLELRILPGKLERGLPKRFTFVFVNRSGHELRMPRPSQCIGGNGTVMLRSQFKPLNPRGVPSGGGGGCGAGSKKIEVLEWLMSWQSLDQGKSLSVSYSRRDLFDFQEDAGDYEFWGEYVPPKLTSEEISLLERAGINFPGVPLASAHLHFKRLN